MSRKDLPGTVTVRTCPGRAQDCDCKDAGPPLCRFLSGYPRCDFLKDVHLVSTGKLPGPSTQVHLLRASRAFLRAVHCQRPAMFHLHLHISVCVCIYICIYLCLYVICIYSYIYLSIYLVSLFIPLLSFISKVYHFLYFPFKLQC